MNKPVHQVVIIGGGFAGLNVARALKNAPCKITLIDRRNHHLFQPLLYQVATGGLSPADIASPIRALLARQKNVSVLLGNVTGFHTSLRQVLLQDGEVVNYDTLIVATGANHAYFGNDQWAEKAPGLKTLEDATRIRHKILYAFERAERAQTEEERQAWLNFVIVGGGPTGVELAGALAELSRHTLRKDFRNIDTTKATIYLVDASERVLSAFESNTSAKAAESLRELGVNVRTGLMVTDVSEDGVTVKTSDGTERVESHTVLWAAGVRASLLGKQLAKQIGFETDRAGRVPVEIDFTIKDHPNIFVLGDLALYETKGRVLPGTAAVAQQEGAWVGKHIAARLKGAKSKPFSYVHYGDLAVIGRSSAVADVGRFRLSGRPAWLFWLFVHLMKLVDMQNRVLVFVQWAWSYLTRKRSARLINRDSEYLGTMSKGDETKPGIKTELKTTNQPDDKSEGTIVNFKRSA